MKKAMAGVLLAALLLAGSALGEIFYRHITQEEAARIMAGDEDFLLLDVRTEEEYDEGHIPGAINLPNEDIDTEPPEALPDKNQMILVYCRSGRRSREASEKLAALGYTQVLEFGGIITWPGDIISTEEELYGDDPFEAREYADPRISTRIGATTSTTTRKQKNTTTSTAAGERELKECKPMKSLLIADTTREEREQIVAESIGNIDGACDGCSPGIIEMYQDYIEGRKELREVNMEFRARYMSGAMGPDRSV